MRTKKQELDVDFIQSRPLTKEEQAKLSEFIQQLKKKKKNSSSRYLKIRIPIFFFYLSIDN